MTRPLWDRFEPGLPGSKQDGSETGLHPRNGLKIVGTDSILRADYMVALMKNMREQIQLLEGRVQTLEDEKTNKKFKQERSNPFISKRNGRVQDKAPPPC